MFNFLAFYCFFKLKMLYIYSNFFEALKYSRRFLLSGDKFSFIMSKMYKI